MIELTEQEQFFESEIQRIKKYLEALIKAQLAYKATLGKSDTIANKEIPSDPRIERPNSSVPSDLVDKIIDTMPDGQEFSSADVFAKLAEELGNTYRKHPNADTMMSCLLGRRVRRGVIEKIGRGVFRKKGGLLSSSPVAML